MLGKSLTKLFLVKEPFFRVSSTSRSQSPMKESPTQLQAKHCINVQKWRVIIMNQHFGESSSQSIFISRWSWPRRKHCWQWRFQGKIPFPSCKKHLHCYMCTKSKFHPRQHTGLTKSCQLLKMNVSLGSTSPQTSYSGWADKSFSYAIHVTFLRWVTPSTGAPWARGMSAMTTSLTTLLL